MYSLVQGTSGTLVGGRRRFQTLGAASTATRIIHPLKRHGRADRLYVGVDVSLCLNELMIGHYMICKAQGSTRRVSLSPESTHLFALRGTSFCFFLLRRQETPMNQVYTTMPDTAKEGDNPHRPALPRICNHMPHVWFNGWWLPHTSTNSAWFCGTTLKRRWPSLARTAPMPLAGLPCWGKRP